MFLPGGANVFPRPSTNPAEGAPSTGFATGAEPQDSQARHSSKSGHARRHRLRTRGGGDDASAPPGDRARAQLCFESDSSDGSRCEAAGQRGLGLLGFGAGGDLSLGSGGGFVIRARPGGAKGDVGRRAGSGQRPDGRLFWSTSWGRRHHVLMPATSHSRQIRGRRSTSAAFALTAQPGTPRRRAAGEAAGTGSTVEGPGEAGSSRHSHGGGRKCRLSTDTGAVDARRPFLGFGNPWHTPRGTSHAASSISSLTIMS